MYMSYGENSDYMGDTMLKLFHQKIQCRSTNCPVVTHSIHLCYQVIEIKIGFFGLIEGIARFAWIRPCNPAKKSM